MKIRNKRERNAKIKREQIKNSERTPKNQSYEQKTENRD